MSSKMLITFCLVFLSQKRDSFNVENLDLPNQENNPKNESEIHFENVHITPEQPLNFKVRAVKQPVEIESGDEIGPNKIRVIIEGMVEDIMKEAESLRELPENERLSAILKLVREKLVYPYSEIIENTKKENSELGEWLEKRFGKNPHYLHSEINEYLEKRYGDCKIMAVLYLLLAQSAGLKGIYASSILPIKNLERPDTKEPIFKSIGVNCDMVSHAWVEIQLEDGTWVPIDISANMLGTGEMSKFFKEAGYNTPIVFGVEGLPKELSLNKDMLVFVSAESEKEVDLSLAIRRESSFATKQYNIPVAEEFSGNVNLKFLPSEDNKSVKVQMMTL